MFIYGSYGLLYRMDIMDALKLTVFDYRGSLLPPIGRIKSNPRDVNIYNDFKAHY